MAFSQSSLKEGTLTDNGRNDIAYRESILAGYFSTTQVFGQLTLQAGLRGEQTVTNGRSYNPDSSVQRRYFNVFPNLTAGHKFKTGLLSAALRQTHRPALL